MIEAINVLSKIILVTVLTLCSIVAIIIGFILVYIGVNEDTMIKKIVFMTLGGIIEFAGGWCLICLST